MPHFETYFLFLKDPKVPKKQPTKIENYFQKTLPKHIKKNNENPQRRNDKNMAKKKNSRTNETSKPPNPQKLYSAKI